MRITIDSLLRGIPGQQKISGTELLPVKNLTKILALTENPENIFFHACEKIRKKIQKKSSFEQPVVRRLIGDEDIMRVAFGHTGICDPDKLCLRVHVGNGL